MRRRPRVAHEKYTLLRDLQSFRLFLSDRRCSSAPPAIGRACGVPCQLSDCTSASSSASPTSTESSLSILMPPTSLNEILKRPDVDDGQPVNAGTLAHSETTSVSDLLETSKCQRLSLLLFMCKLPRLPPRGETKSFSATTPSPGINPRQRVALIWRLSIRSSTGIDQESIWPVTQGCCIISFEKIEIVHTHFAPWL